MNCGSRKAVELLARRAAPPAIDRGVRQSHGSNKFLVDVHGGAGEIRRAHGVPASAGSTDVQAHPGTV